MRGDKKRTPVVGVGERKGRAKAFTIENLKGSTLLSIAQEHILPESTVYTDELPAYDGIQYMRNRYNHRRIQGCH